MMNVRIAEKLESKCIMSCRHKDQMLPSPSASYIRMLLPKPAQEVQTDQDLEKGVCGVITFDNDTSYNSIKLDE